MKESEENGEWFSKPPEDRETSNIPPPPGNIEDYVWVIPLQRWLPRGIPDADLADEDIEAWFRKQHPEWDEERITLELERVAMWDTLEELEDMKTALEGKEPTEEQQAALLSQRRRLVDQRVTFGFKWLEYLLKQGKRRE